MRNNYFIIRKQALREDGWTYGDWRQYVANRDDGSVQCCKHSQLPLLPLIIGICLLEMVALAVFMTPVIQSHPAPLNLGYVYTLSVVGFTLFGIGAGLYIGDYRLMYAVGPKSFDGKRHFWSEVEND